MNIKVLLLTVTMGILLSNCDKSEDPAGVRGLAVVPSVTDINPAFFDSKSMDVTYIEFVVGLEEGKTATEAIVEVSYKGLNQRAEIKKVTAFPATIRISLKDAAAKLGVALSAVQLGDMFTFEVLCTSNGVTTRSNAVVNAAVACAYVGSNAIGSYHVVSADWATAGNVTLTTDPADPFTIYVSGLASIDGAVEDKGPLVMHINPFSFAVTAAKKAISTDYLGYTNGSFGGTGLYNSCDGSYTMLFAINVDEGSFGSYTYVFTRN